MAMLPALFVDFTVRDAEMPGLLVACRRCQYGGLDDHLYHFVKYRPFLKLTDASSGFHDFKKYHGALLSE
jgi:hypothetical protein